MMKREVSGAMARLLVLLLVVLVVWLVVLVLWVWFEVVLELEAFTVFAVSLLPCAGAVEFITLTVML